MWWSDRGNRTNLFGVDLNSGRMTQLTDWDPARQVNRHCLVKNPAREEICCNYDGKLWAIDLLTLEARVLIACPDGYHANLSDITADGKYLMTGFVENTAERLASDLNHGYVGFQETWAARPHCTIVKVPLGGGKAQTIHEDRCWFGHLNCSPKLPGLMTFCHEGPWDVVDHRIWGLDIETGRTWKIRPTGPDQTVGHEYWMADGEHVGYHGRSGSIHFYGSIRYDNTDCIEAELPGRSWHFHSHMLDLLVGDGNANEPYLLAWRLRNGKFDGPKVLAWHRGSFHSQCLHVHPRVCDNGARVLYTADPQSYGQVFIVDVPVFDALPDRAEVTRSKEV